MSSLGKYVSDGAVNAINSSLSVMSIFFIAIAAAVYLLVDMHKIRREFKEFLLSRNKRLFNYFKILDTEMKNYSIGFIKIVGITLIEYTLAFLIIGHPNALLLGCLAAIATLIPYFGGLITNVIAAITAFVISPGLFIRTIICFAVLSAVDGYVINPYIYGKTNEVHPLVVIFSVFAGGILFGIVGIIISLPLAIILIATYKFYKRDISEKLEENSGEINIEKDIVNLSDNNSYGVYNKVHKITIENGVIKDKIIKIYEGVPIGQT
jgi:predicted PurR-regulated permease PerM